MTKRNLPYSTLVKKVVKQIKIDLADNNHSSLNKIVELSSKEIRLHYLKDKVINSKISYMIADQITKQIVEDLSRNKTYPLEELLLNFKDEVLLEFV